MKTNTSVTVSSLIVLFASTITACALEDFPEEVDSTTEPVTGGTPVTNVDPYDGVVRITSTVGGCTASKIGARRYLTAAHCLVPLTAGDQIRIATSPAGTPLTTYTLTRTDVHPSYLLGIGRTYDVGVFEISSEPAGVRTLTLRASYVPAGERGIMVGHGCDNTSADDGTKQDAPVQAAGQADPDIATHSLTNLSSTVASCSGDSGGPFLIRTGIGSGPWEITGVNQRHVGEITNPPDVISTSFWTRTGNIRQWIVNPGVNSFANGSVGTFLSGDSGKCLGVGGGSTEPDARVAQFYCDGRQQPFDNQYWRLQSIGGGFFVIVNTKSNLCLGVGGGSTEDGAVIAQYGCDPTPTPTENQAWRFVFSRDGGGGGYYQVRNGKSGKCIGIDGGSNNNGATASQFTCSSLGGLNNQTFLFSR